MSASLKDRKLSLDTRMKMSEARKGHPFWGKRGYKMSDQAKQNIREGILAKRYNADYAKKLSESKSGTKNPQSKLTPVKVAEIRHLYAEGHSQQSLANMFGVKRSTVQDIVQRKTWKHI